MSDCPDVKPDAPPRRRILVVDDTRLAAYTLGKLLEALGHQAFIAYDAESALQTANTERPDLVFTDISMPEIDGYELLNRLRQCRELDGVPVVALTGYGDESERQRMATAGFHERIVKPVSLGMLQTLLATLPFSTTPRGSAPN